MDRGTLRAPRDIECSRVVGVEDGRPPADDPAAEVLVLGDSFLRIYQRDEPGGTASWLTWLINSSARLPRSLATVALQRWCGNN